MSFFNIDKFFLLEDLLNEVKAYHGSPYNFDKFDTAFIGTGEKAQVHGWGLYFSLNPETVYRRYGRRITRDNPKAYRIISYKNKSYEKGGQMYKLLSLVVNNGKDEAIDKISELLSKKSYIEKHPEYVDLLDRAKTLISNMDTDNINEIEFFEGQNYTVEIPDIDTYLVEYKKWNQQPANVRKAFKEIYNEMNANANGSANYTINKQYNGKDLYYALANALSDFNSHERADKLASLELLKHGVPGIYYDGYTDGKCVVIFTGNDVKILSKDRSTEENKMELSDDDVSELTEEDVANIKNMSQEMQMAIVKDRIDLFNYINNPSPKTCLEAIKKNSSLIKFIDNPTEEMQKIAIKDNPSYIFNIKNPTKEIIKLAIENGLNYVDDLIEKFSDIIDDELFMLCLKSKNNSNMYSYFFGRAYNPVWNKYKTTELYNKALKDKDILNNLFSYSSYIAEFIREISANLSNYDNLDKDALAQLEYKFFNNNISDFKYSLKYKNVLSLLKEKDFNNIIVKIPALAKGFKINDTIQMKIIKRNPFNIRYIYNPSKQVVDKALEMNPDVKDYLL